MLLPDQVPTILHLDQSRIFLLHYRLLLLASWLVLNILVKVADELEEGSPPPLRESYSTLWLRLRLRARHLLPPSHLPLPLLHAIHA